jgi:DNA-binding transcriptional ArsR family regulator
VQRLANAFSVTRPAVSQHLRVLKDAGLVAARAEGTRRIYRIDPRGVQAMRDYLDKFWDRALVAFKEAAEAEEES